MLSPTLIEGGRLVSDSHRDTNKIPREQIGRLQCTHERRQNYHPKNMAATSKDELLFGGGIRYLTATSHYRANRKQVPASISNIV